MKDIYIQVDVEKELPEDVGWYNVVFGVDSKMFAWWNDRFWECNAGHLNGVTHWLKPVPLTSIIQQFCNFNHIPANEKDIEYFLDNRLRV